MMKLESAAAGGLVRFSLGAVVAAMFGCGGDGS